MDRSQFNKSLAALLGISLLPESRAGQTYPFRSLHEAFKAINFNPSSPGSSFFVVTADVHYGTKNSSGLKPIIAEINKMSPPPVFFCINGDLIMTASRSFGRIPDDKEREIAGNELKDFKKDIALLNPAIPLKITLGNHDTHPGEVDPDLFWEVFPEHPPYQSFDAEGMHIICLNGHSTGYIDQRQLEWLHNDVRSQPETKGIIVLIHQPSMHHTIRERGIPDALSDAFDKHRGPIWLIGGHDHTNSEELFRLSNTVLVQHRITCGADNIWGDDERPGYWIYCLRDGEVAGRIFRQQQQGYRIQPAPERTDAVTLPVRIGMRDQAVWRCLVGENDHPYRVRIAAADCLNYWMYVKELVYKIPIGQSHNQEHVNLVLYVAFKDRNNSEKKGQYFVSNDATLWRECHPYHSTPDSAYFKIGNIRKEPDALFVKFTPIGETAFAGLALLP